MNLNAEVLKAAVGELPDVNTYEGITYSVEVNYKGVLFVVRFELGVDFLGFNMPGWYLTSITKV